MTHALKTFSKAVPSQAKKSNNSLPSQESRKLSVNADDLATLMFTLTDLYSDPNMAILREYTTNARDAHLHVGQDAPIEVTLPSFNNPNFVVADHGVGMSKEELLTVYSEFIRSTKKGDMNQVGAYGLGCKSALTLVDQFTIESVKDGKRTLAVMSRNSDGGSMDILSHEDTEDDNGTVVTITIPNVSQFNTNADTFFSTWKPGTVLVNGEKPLKSIYESGFYHHKNIHIKPLNRSAYYGMQGNKLYLMVDGFAYRVNDELVSFRMDLAFADALSEIYVEVPIGLVDFTPAREALRYTDRVNALIRETLDYLSANRNEIIREHVAAAKTRSDALKTLLAWRVKDNASPRPVWKGEEVVTNIRLKADVRSMVRAERETRFKRSWVRNIPVVIKGTNRSHIYIVTGKLPVADAYMTRIVKSHFELGSSNNSRVAVFFVEDKEEVQSKWLLENDNVSFGDATEMYEAYKVKQQEERKNRPATASKPSTLGETLKYPVLYIEPDEGKVTNERLSLNDFMTLDSKGIQVFYLSSEDLIKRSGWFSRYDSPQSIVDSVVNHRDDLGKFLPKNSYIFIIQAPRRVDAFIRRLAKLTEIQVEDALSVFKSNVHDLLNEKGLSTTALALMRYYRRDIDMLSKLNEEAKALIPKEIREAMSGLDILIKHGYLARQESLSLGFKYESEAKDSIRGLINEFPLLEGMRTYGFNSDEKFMSDMSLYMIAKNTSAKMDS